MVETARYGKRQNGTITMLVVGTTTVSFIPPLSPRSVVGNDDAERGFSMLLETAVADFELDCKVRKLSHKTIRNYTAILRLFTKFVINGSGIGTLEEIRVTHIKQFLLDAEERGRKPQYINDLLKVLKVFFKYHVEEGTIPHNPTERIHNVKQPKVLIRTFREDEIRRLLNYFNKLDFLSVRNKTLLAMLFDTGLRCNEALTMTFDQIHSDFILVHGKGNKERMVPVSPYLGKLLLRYRSAYDGYFSDRLPPAKLVFVSKNGKQLTEEAVTKFMKAAAEAVGVNSEVRVSPHTCRHTFAHLQLKNGLDLYSLSRLMGHENIAITQRYLEGIRNDEVLEKARATSVLLNL